METRTEMACPKNQYKSPKNVFAETTIDIDSLVVTTFTRMKIKMAITGTGTASKEQVAGMLQRMLHLDPADMPKFLDATDALAAAYCHYLQMGRPDTGKKGPKSWKEYISSNPEKVSKRK